MKIRVIKFYHISTGLIPSKTEELTKLYLHYHKLVTCYRWMYKRLKKIKLSLNMTSIRLTVVGSVVGGVTLNPIIIGVLIGSSVMIQGYVTKSNLANKVQQCKFAYTSYDKVLI